MVTDFGVAKALSASTLGDGGLTSVGVALGTPASMSPEQATVDPLVDHRTDVYAWGVLAYELLTGATPFAGRTAAAMLAAHVIEPVEPITNRNATIPPALAALVMRCLAKNPAERPQRADEIVATLDTINTPSQGTVAHASVLLMARKPRVMQWAGPVGLLAVALFVWLKFRDSNAGTGASGAKSVAVLPFENAGGDSTQEYLADGMTDDIASALVNGGVRVAARTSSYSYKGKHPTPQEVGNTLHVDVVLLSTIHKFGERMRVTAELVNARDGVAIWSYSSGDRDAMDIFAVQHAITDSIVGALKIKLATKTSRPAIARNEDRALHDVVMRARYFANLPTPTGIQHGIDLFRQVIARDSLNTDARLGLAFALAEQADGSVPPSDVFPEAIAQVKQVLALDSLNARAWAVSAALTAQYAYDWPRTRREIDRARALNPDDAGVDLAEVIYWMA